MYNVRISIMDKARIDKYRFNKQLLYLTLLSQFLDQLLSSSS